MPTNLQEMTNVLLYKSFTKSKAPFDEMCFNPKWNLINNLVYCISNRIQKKLLWYEHLVTASLIIGFKQNNNSYLQ